MKVSKRTRVVVGALAAIVVIAASSVGVGRLVSERRISREVDDLFAASQDVEAAVVTEAEIAGLPEPVQRWLRYAQVVGKQRPSTVRLKMDGQFRLGEDKGWMPFEAEEYYTTDPPGFVWSVSMEMAPLITIRGRDRYVEGKGDIDMRLLGLVPVARTSGGALDQGAMLRYLNEIMWFPAAALSPYITWKGIDANSAEATMSYGGVTSLCHVRRRWARQARHDDGGTLQRCQGRAPAVVDPDQRLRRARRYADTDRGRGDLDV